MKKTLALVLVMMFVLSASLVTTVSAEDAVLEGEWYPWIMDGSEVTLGSVKIDDSMICDEFSSNWEIRAQDIQEKITETYMTPASVWTTDASEDFVLAFKVNPGSFVQIGFLHNVGQGSADAGFPIIATDGSDATDKMTLEYSVDGETWYTCTGLEVIGETDGKKLGTLTSGMTGYEAPIMTHVGDGVAAYSEDYFVIQGTVGSEANYVRYTYFADGRTTNWDPCIRDAVVTAPTSSGDSSEGAETPDTGDNTILFVIAMGVALTCAVVVVARKRRA